MKTNAHLASIKIDPSTEVGKITEGPSNQERRITEHRLTHKAVRLSDKEQEMASPAPGWRRSGSVSWHHLPEPPGNLYQEACKV